MGLFLTFLFGDDSSTKVQPMDSGALLKEATVNKAAGNMTGAIELLKQFWVAEQFGSSGYGVEAYLKLPMYLQNAGRRDEAWHALNVLITGYVLSSAKLNEQVLPMMQSERRRNELRDCASRETIEAMVKPLLKKAKSLSQTTAICDLVESEMRKLPIVDVNSFAIVDQIILRK